MIEIINSKGIELVRCHFSICRIKSDEFVLEWSSVKLDVCNINRVYDLVGPIHLMFVETLNSFSWERTKNCFARSSFTVAYLWIYFVLASTKKMLKIHFVQILKLLWSCTQEDSGAQGVVCKSEWNAEYSFIPHGIN